MVLDHDPEHKVGATFDRSNLSQSKISREGSIGRDDKDSVTGLVAIPAVIFFPGDTS